MAGKITELTALTSASTDDLLEIVDDPAGVPVSKKITVDNFQKSLGVVGKVTVTQPATASTLTIADGATLTASATATVSGTNTGDKTITLSGDVTGTGTGSFAATIANDAVTYAKIQNVSATDKLLGRSTAGAGDVEEITCTAAGRALLDDAAASNQRTTLGLGGAATLSVGTSAGTVAAGDHNHSAVYQPLDSDLTTIAGLTATSGNFIQSSASAWASRTPTQVTADLIAVVGDSGSGGTKGLVPAPAAGDAAANKYLKASGAWATVPSSASPLTTKGDVYTFSTVDARLAVGTNGQVLTADSAAATGIKWANPAGGGDALTASPLSQFAATTSAQLAGVISDETGSGALVFGTSPALTTPTLGVASATSINKVAITAPATSATLTIANAQTLTVNGSTTLTNGTHSGTNTGDQTITLTGNVTGSGTGSFAATIANDAVTYAKIQNVSATDKVLGRSTAGSGDVEEIACTLAGRNLIDDATNADQRTTLGLGGAAVLSVGTGAGTVAAGDHNHTGVYEPANANLLETGDIGVSVQAYDADLGTIASLTATSGNFIQSASSAWASRTPTQVTADLIAVVGDSGSGGTKGLVPAPATGDAAAGKYLKADGTWATVSATGSGTKTYSVFTAMNNQPPASAYATLDTRNNIAVLDFDTTTEESAVFVGVIPEGASLGSGLIVRISWTATSATTGDCRWGAMFMRCNADITADSYGTTTEVTTTTAGAAGTVSVTSITSTTIDSVAAGDTYRLKIYRDVGDAADTMAGDAELITVEVRSAA